MENKQHGHRYTLTQYIVISAIWMIVLPGVSLASYQLRSFSDSLLLYLPTAFSIMLVHWYGLRMLPIIYINAIITLVIWNAKGDWVRIMTIASHEPLVAFASKYIVDRFHGEKITEYFKSTHSFVRFTILGIIIPISFNSFYTYNYSFINGDMEKVGLLWLSDFITIFCLSVPMLFFFCPDGRGIIRPARRILFTKSKFSTLEFWLLTLAFATLSFFVPFGEYWFIYGIVTVIMGVRHGFEPVLLLNAILFLLNYILPLIDAPTAISFSGSTQLINVHLGNATMLFVSTLVGRVVSDLRATEETLTSQKIEIEQTNRQLNQTNQELDRFVYSVSHDLSAPLKSIQGLIHVSRMESKNEATLPYLDMMEKSARRLEDFINEVLDYAKTSRKEINKQNVELNEIVNGLKEKLAFNERKNLKFELLLDSPTLLTDPTLLKIAMGNLLSNALKFQKSIPGHVPYIGIKSQSTPDQTEIEIIDNGEGIPEDHLEKIFDMFYRATSKSPGSGLGLYIAREAVNKLDGRISVSTKYGEGSVFKIIFPSAN